MLEQARKRGATQCGSKRASAAPLKRIPALHRNASSFRFLHESSPLSLVLPQLYTAHQLGRKSMRFAEKSSSNRISRSPSSNPPRRRRSCYRMSTGGRPPPPPTPKAPSPSPEIEVEPELPRQTRSQARAAAKAKAALPERRMTRAQAAKAQLKDDHFSLKVALQSTAKATTLKNVKRLDAQKKTSRAKKPSAAKGGKPPATTIPVAPAISARRQALYARVAARRRALDEAAATQDANERAHDLVSMDVCDEANDAPGPVAIDACNEANGAPGQAPMDVCDEGPEPARPTLPASYFSLIAGKERRDLDAQSTQAAIKILQMPDKRIADQRKATASGRAVERASAEIRLRDALLLIGDTRKVVPDLVACLRKEWLYGELQTWNNKQFTHVAPPEIDLEYPTHIGHIHGLVLRLRNEKSSSEALKRSLDLTMNRMRIQHLLHDAAIDWINSRKSQLCLLHMQNDIPSPASDMHGRNASKY
uniref:Uncharacterized protein n=1 Tax=Mycena chlorophos TaxID=658473 RepID=A0ABQ0LA53_MYCCL|nr:predicted protein [Mycena chlorophos]